MKVAGIMLTALVLAAALGSATASAEILAMMNYESKPAEELKSLKLGGPEVRREGIAILDVDPESPRFGQWLVDIPLNPDGIAHHIFYDRTMTKAYLTSLAQPALRVMDMRRFPPRLEVVDVPNCSFAEDVIFDEANEHWYLTCMDSANVWKGRVADDAIVAEIELPGTYPHGLGIDSDIGRIVVTSTIDAAMTAPDEVVSIVDAETLEPIRTIKLSHKDSPSGEAPVEVLPVPGDGPPTFVVTNMFGGSLWSLTWDEATEQLQPAMAIDLASLDGNVPLEIYFNEAGDRLYITTSNPGHLHVFDVSGGVGQAEPIASIPTAGGAHHVAFTRDGRYAFVQNSFLNLPDMSDGSITVVDLATNAAVATIDTLKDAGFNPNSIVLLPEWNDFAGH